MSKIRCAVLGAGRIGTLHAKNLAFRVPGAELAWVADVDAAAARRVADATGAKATDDHRRVLEDRDVQAVIVASATDTHAALIVEAAGAGKDVFCEKPIDLSLPAIDRALEAVSRSRVRLQVGFNRRFDPGFAEARRRIAEGAIGKPHMVRITSRDPGLAPMGYLRVSGGIFKDMTIHDFDMARWIVGEEVESLFAMGSVLIEPGLSELSDVDTALISLRYGSGALGAIDDSRRAVYGYDVRLEVFGSEGCVTVGNRTATSVSVAGTAGILHEGPLHWFAERFEEAYVRELVHFVECLARDEVPSVGGEDGRIPIMMAEAAKASLERGIPVAIAREAQRAGSGV